MPIAAVLSLTSIAWRVSHLNDLIVRMGPPGGPNGSLPAWQDNRTYLHRRSVPLPSRSATRSAHRTTHPATPRPRPGRLHVRSTNRRSWSELVGYVARGTVRAGSQKMPSTYTSAPAKIRVLSGAYNFHGSDQLGQRSSRE